MKLSSNLSEQVLTAGLEYKEHRGGIGGVINTYAGYFPAFKFISTYKPQKYKINILPYFLISIIKLIGLLSSDKKIAIVHIHGAAKGSLLRKFIVFYISKYFFRCKVIYHSHGSEFKVFYEQSNQLIKWVIKYFLENVDLVICLSIQWRSFFDENFIIHRIVVLENIVHQVVSPIKRVSKSTGSINILFLGAIGERKGVFDLLDAINDNKSTLEGRLRLTIGGNGEVNKLTAYLKENNLENIVTFEGWVTGEKKLTLLKEADVYILPSYNEGLPLSILEAMSFSLPIISTPVGGTPEVVKEGVNGFLVNPGDKLAIYNSLKRFIDDPLLLTSMGACSLKIVEPYYPHNVIPKLQKVYEVLLE